MLELRKISSIYSGVAVQEGGSGIAHFVRLSDLSDLRSGRAPNLATGEPPAVARALPIEEGDLIVAARVSTTDVCQAAHSWLGAFISLDLYLVRPDRRRSILVIWQPFSIFPRRRQRSSGNKQGTGLARLPKEALDRLVVPLRRCPRKD